MVVTDRLTEQLPPAPVPFCLSGVGGCTVQGRSLAPGGLGTRVRCVEGHSWGGLGAGVDESSVGPQGSLNSELITPWWGQGQGSGFWECVPLCQSEALQGGHPLVAAPWSLLVL